VLIDSHAHLFFKDYQEDLDSILTRIQEAGIGQLINVGTDLETSRQAILFAEKHPWIFAAVGVHPHDVAKMADDDFSVLKELAKHPKVVAIGEVGLDYYYEHSPKEIQQKRLREFVHLAREVDLPLILHCRDAFEDCFKILDEEKGWEHRGVFHCYTGDLQTAKKIVKHDGWYVSFSGIVTFKKNVESLQEAARKVPAERILVETDSPFLAPLPHRGKRNEPAYVRLVAEKLAELRGISLAEIETITTSNAQKLFQLP